MAKCRSKERSLTSSSGCRHTIAQSSPYWTVAAGFAVHALTASGAALGLAALLTAADARWAVSFGWLGAALIVDAVDGPIARRVQVKMVLPRFSGEDLDKIVDYLTYVTVPAFMTARSQIAPDGIRLALALAMMVVSLYHFADQKSKTGEGYFVGFPAIWNAIVLYCFVLALPQNAAVALICLCLALTFVPLRWVHPVRVRRMRTLTAAVTALWAAAAIWTLWYGFPGEAGVKVIFAATAAYMLALGLSAGGRSIGKR